MDQIETGPLNKRLESMITTGMDAEIKKVAKQLAGNADPKNFRSKAVRKLLALGIREHVLTEEERAGVKA